MDYTASFESLLAEGSSNGALVAIGAQNEELMQWRPILQLANQVVLYNPTSHALVLQKSASPPAPPTLDLCPYCSRQLPPGFHQEDKDIFANEYHTRVPNYFQLLSMANETLSRPSSPPPVEDESVDETPVFPAEMMAQGYMNTFFREEARLGMGANGTVFLCQHMLDGNPLGHFAVKKIAVGESHAYLLNILREVRLLERLHHPNIVVYHHAWLETCQFSQFGPKVPTLHVLMQWAECGSLDDYIDARLGKEVHPLHGCSSTPSTDDATTSAPLSRTARIRAFRAMQRADPEERKVRNLGQRKAATWKAIHLLSPEEVKSLFTDVVQGLAFLHDRSILHLDLKPGNVLLTMDEGALVPRAMLSDFGTSRDDISQSAKIRSGNTGTLEFASPESLRVTNPLDSKSDMWSLGLILHKLLSFRLPWRTTDSEHNTSREGDAGNTWVDRLEGEILAYPGFKGTPALVKSFEARRIPRAYAILLEGLLNVAPSARPSADRVLGAIRDGRLDPLPRDSNLSTIVPVRRRSFVVDDSVDQDIPSGSVVQDDEDEELVAMPVSTNNHSDKEWPDAVDPKREHQQLLELPGPPVPHSYISRAPWRLPITAYVRAIKSSILILKIVTLSIPLCGKSLLDNRLLFTLLAALGVLDTLFENFTSSLVLGILHFGLLAIVKWLGGSCTHL